MSMRRPVRRPVRCRTSSAGSTNPCSGERAIPRTTGLIRLMSHWGGIRRRTAVLSTGAPRSRAGVLWQHRASRAAAAGTGAVRPAPAPRPAPVGAALGAVAAARSGVDDLPAGGQLVELPHRDDVLDLRHE